MTRCDKCINQRNRRICKLCDDWDCFEEMPITNAERIRKMDDVDLAKFIGAVKCNTYMIECGYPACLGMVGRSCVGIEKKPDKDILEWLKKEVVY